MLSGKGTIRLRNRSLKIREGTIVLLNSNEAHEIHSDPEGIDVIVTQISRHFCDEYFSDIKSLEFIENDISGQLGKGQNSEIFALLCTSALSYIRGEALYKIETVEKICRILLIILQNVPSVPLSDSEYASRLKRIRRMNSITEYLDAHYQEKTSLADLSEREGLTPTHFSHFFTGSFGVSFQEYINNLRFEKAMRLIHEPGKNLLAVALESGFSDSKYMNRMFLKRLGCTPKQYRTSLSLDTLAKEKERQRLQYYYNTEESLRLIEKQRL